MQRQKYTTEIHSKKTGGGSGFIGCRYMTVADEYGRLGGWRSDGANDCCRILAIRVDVEPLCAEFCERPRIAVPVGFCIVNAFRLTAFRWMAFRICEDGNGTPRILPTIGGSRRAVAGRTYCEDEDGEMGGWRCRRPGEDICCCRPRCVDGSGTISMRESIEVFLGFDVIGACGVRFWEVAALEGRRLSSVSFPRWALVWFPLLVKTRWNWLLFATRVVVVPGGALDVAGNDEVILGKDHQERLAMKASSYCCCCWVTLERVLILAIVR